MKFPFKKIHHMEQFKAVMMNQSAMSPFKQILLTVPIYRTKKTLVQEDENKDVCSSQEADHVKIVKEEKVVYDEIDDIDINPNPSYDLVPGGIELEGNPSYSYGIK